MLNSLRIVAKQNVVRSFATSTSKLQLKNFTVMFDEFGDPLNVLRHEECPMPTLKDADSLLLKVLGM